MSMQDWSENVILVQLPAEAEASQELDQVIGHIRDRKECDVIVDFSNITILTSTSLASLLRLRKLLNACGRRLSLCCMGHTTRGIISVTGLDRVFEICDDRFDALAKVQVPPKNTTSN